MQTASRHRQETAAAVRTGSRCRRSTAQYEYCAVPVAEDITARFLNVVALFNGCMPRADLDLATYVTFCLGERHGSGDWYRYLCSPDNPDGVRTLKRVRERRSAVVIVEGDVPRALDSGVLGPVRLDEIRGWWRPAIVAGARNDGI